MSGRDERTETLKGPTYVTRSGRTTTIKVKTQRRKMLSPEQFAQLLDRIPASAPPMRGSFTNCNYSYNGAKDAEVVEAFLSAVNIFKRSADIGDRTALDELPILLKGEAGIWWLGVKSDVTSWLDFETRLRENFAPVREPYLIYLDITQEKQLQGMSTEDFVRRKRMLFSQLPSPRHPETQQLDIIFGLLHLDIRDKVARADVRDFKDLLKAAKAAEHVLREKEVDAHQSEAPKLNESRPDTRSAPNKKTRCRYCRNFGHSTENCRKLAARNEIEHKDVQPETELVAQVPSSRFKCYGCGTPGVVRSNCPTCHTNKSQRPQPEIGFCSVATFIDARDRPVIYVDIGGVTGAAYLDTCAKSSIASYSLYCELRKKGYAFKEYKVGVTLADGIQRPQNVLVTQAPVKINDRTIRTTLLVLPESRRNRTLLGVGFIQDAHIDLNLAQYTWHFIEDPTQEFELYEESFALGKGVALAAVTPDEDPSLSPSLPEESNTARSYGPLIKIDAPSPPKKRPHYGYPYNHSPILEALYEDARHTLRNYDQECDLDDFESTLFPATSVSSVGVTVLDDFL